MSNGLFGEFPVGNKKFRETIYLRLKEYIAITDRFERGQLFDSVADTIHNNGGHFLRKEKDRWAVLSARQAREKVGHAMRDALVQLQKPTKKRRRMEVDRGESSQQGDESLISQILQSEEASLNSERVQSNTDLLINRDFHQGSCDQYGNTLANMLTDPLCFPPDETASCNETDLSDNDQDFTGLINAMVG